MFIASWREEIIVLEFFVNTYSYFEVSAFLF